MKKLFAIVLMLFVAGLQWATAQTIVVDQSGKGNFKTITEALKSLPDSSKTDRTILIKKGIYHEKVFVTQSHVVLKGEDEKGTVITQAIARDIFHCETGGNDDWGVATINLRGSDITLKNLTIINSYGFDHKTDTTFNCTEKGQLTQHVVHPIGHQMTLRSFDGATRLKVIDCQILGRGNDTVSPWNGENGMFYFKNCVMEGAVDMYCPKGWAYAEGCKFVCHSMNAGIWHNGAGNQSQKSVLVNCTFVGDDGFKLGRYHVDSQFYLINCNFAKNMADAVIYKAPSGPGAKYGQRTYYYNCHHDGGDFAWLKNNLNEAAGAPQAKQITAEWAMDGKWNPSAK